MAITNNEIASVLISVIHSQALTTIAEVSHKVNINMKHVIK